MKSILYSLLIVIPILLMSSCTKWSDKSTTVIFFKGEEINGLSLHIHPNTTINQSDTNTFISIEINDELLDKLVVNKDEHGIVSISIKNFIMPNTGKFIYNVTANINKINLIESYDGAKITATGDFYGDNTKILLNGGAKISGLKLNLKDSYNLEMWGSSKIEDTIACKQIDARIQMQSSIKSFIKNCEQANYNIAGRSTVNIQSDSTNNNSGNINIAISDDSTIDASTSPFKTSTVKSSKSTTKVYIKDNLNCDLTYKSKLYYKGEPNITQTVSADSELINDN